MLIFKSCTQKTNASTARDDYKEHKNGTHDDDEYDGVDSGNDPPSINYADPTYCDLATLQSNGMARFEGQIMGIWP